jgi:hypothetical protein
MHDKIIPHQALPTLKFRKMFRELMAIITLQMMTSRSLICLLKNQNGGKLQKIVFYLRERFSASRH